MFSRQELRQLIRFGLAAGLATLVHLAIAEAVLLLAPSTSVFKANLVAFLPAVAVSYLGQRHFAFRSSGKVTNFVVLAILGFSLNNLLLVLVTAQGIPAPVGLPLAVLASPVLTYLGCRQWVFSRVRAPN